MGWKEVNAMLRKLRVLATTTIVAVVAFAGNAPAYADITVTRLGVDAQTGGDWYNSLISTVPPFDQMYGPYGSCFSVTSQASPRKQLPEVEIGPDFYMVPVDPNIMNGSFYYENRCSADMVAAQVSGCTSVGDLIPAREVIDGTPLDSAVCVTEQDTVTTAPQFFDFRFHRMNGASEDNAFAWSFLEEPYTGDPNPGVPNAYEVLTPEAANEIYGTDSGPAEYNPCLETYRASTFDNVSGVNYLGRSATIILAG
jgi:hypothetical protein